MSDRPEVYYGVGDTDFVRNSENRQYHISAFSKAEKVDFVHYHGSLDDLTSVKHLALTMCNTRYIQLPILEKLEVAECKFLTGFDGYNLVDLDIEFCDSLIRIPDLPKCNHAVISSCNNLVDISGLHGVPDVELSFCNDLTDITPLSQANNVNLTHMGSLVDVSVLADAEVKLCCCYEVVDVTALRCVLITKE